MVFWGNFSCCPALHPGGSICNTLGEQAPSHQAGDVCTAVCCDYCSSGAEIPLQAFLLMCLSLVLVLGILCIVCLFVGFFCHFITARSSLLCPPLSLPPLSSLTPQSTPRQLTAPSTDILWCLRQNSYSLLYLLSLLKF